MNEKEFLQQATSKIYSFRKKQIIANELHDHIQLKKKRFEEAGYTEEQAEEKAVDNMGDADEIAKALAELHRSRFNWIDLLALLITLAVICAAHYLLNGYAFGDPGVISLLICGIFFASAVYFLFAAYTVSRKNVFAACYLFSGGMCIALIRELAAQISGLTGGSIENLKTYIFSGSIDFSESIKGNSMANTAVLIFGILFGVTAIIALVLAIKKELDRQSKADIIITKFFTAVFVILFAVSAVISAYFGISTVSRVQALRSEYNSAFELLTQLEKNCRTQEEAAEFIENSEYDFYRNEENGKIEGYGFGSNLFYITVEFYHEEDKIQYEEVGGIPGIYLDLLQDQNDAEAASYVYSVTLAIDDTPFENGYDSITLRDLKSDEDEIKELYSFIPYEHTTQEEIEYYTQYTPVTYKFIKYKQGLATSRITYQYLEDSGAFSDMHYFEISRESQELLDFKEKESEITEILKTANLDNSAEIARLTETTAVKSIYTPEGYAARINLICNWINKNSMAYYYKDKLKDAHGELTSYKISGDWQFTVLRYSDFDIAIFENGVPIMDTFAVPLDIYVKETDLNGKRPFEIYTDNNGFIKYSFDGCFFDKQGLCYGDTEKIRYYTEGGETYRYYSTVDNENPDPETRKRYYLQNMDGETYLSDKCFIDQNGWLVIDKQGAIKESADGTYKNSAGEVFTAVFKTSWDGNGNLVDVNAYE